MSLPARRPALRGTDLTRTYQRGGETVRALDGVNVELRPGELVGLVGPSGSGKTTLLSILSGWERPDAGTVVWDGHLDVRGVPGWDLLAVVPQALGLLDDLDVIDNVSMPLRFWGDHEFELAAADDRCHQLLRQFGVDHLPERLPTQTSLGEQQRVAVARALALSPRILLADEPTAHQDHDRATAIAAALHDAAADGTCCLVATHDPAVLAGFDRVLTMRDGRVV